MKVAVLRFPGSNADFDALHAVRDVLGLPARYVFHKNDSLDGAEAVIVPGGFSYGDYLRPGAIATFSPITAALRAFAAAGGPVLGICNGFQILTELGLLPGALTRNANLRFVCRDVHLQVASDSFWTKKLHKGEVLRLPVAHADGCYVGKVEQDGSVEGGGRVAFRYCDASGEVSEAANPNGSVLSTAGVSNRSGNVVGLMPHPERASEPILGCADGAKLLSALLS